MIVPLVWLASYFVGSIPFGWLMARLRGVDIQKEGSGNIGATNVGRVLGKPLGLLVFCLDFAKGALPVVIAGRLSSDGDGMLEVGAGLAAFIGHVFPIFLLFRGGKGVATASGAAAALFPIPALVGLITFLAVVTATRVVSLACLSAVLALDGLYLLQHGPRLDDPRAWFLAIATALIFLRHAGNIQRLWSGQERRIREHRVLTPTARSLHVLALGMWTGAAIFFSFVAAPSLFRDFESIAREPADQRPIWLPLPDAFVGDAVIGPKEQGSRIAGVAVGGIFPIYFLWQYVCGVVALGTSLAWPKIRPWLIAVAFAGVVVGWPIERIVADLREPRNAATDAYLQAPASDRVNHLPAMTAARSRFAAWHVASLFLNMGVIATVVTALTLAGNLPVRDSDREETV